MKITAIESYIVVAPDLREDATSSSQDNIVVVVYTDTGIFGVGETDTGPWIAKSVIESPGSHSMALGILAFNNFNRNLRELIFSTLLIGINRSLLKNEQLAEQVEASMYFTQYGFFFRETSEGTFALVVKPRGSRGSLEILG